MATVRGQRDYLYKTWWGSQRCKPKLYFEPESRDDLQEILQKAVELSKHVRVAGSGHSFNDQVCCDDYLISLKQMNKILQINKEAQTVKVEGGAIMGNIHDALAKEGLGLVIYGSAKEATIAGSVCTGTKNSGVNYPSMGSYVLEMELMTADGNVHTISRTMDEELHRAAAVSLGTLGVILTLTMQCEPVCQLQQKHVVVDIDDVIGSLDNIARGSRHTSIKWTPYSGACIKYISKTDKTAPRAKPSFLRRTLSGYLEFFYWLSSYFLFLVPWINKLAHRFLISYPSILVGRKDEVLCGPFPKNTRIIEWAVPYTQGAETLKELKDWIYKNKYPAHMVVSIGFVARDDFYLSIANGRDVCTFLIFMFRPYGDDVDYKPYWDAIKDIAMKRGGRFHWMDDPQASAAEMSDMYPDMEKFLEIRKRMDPQGRFLTPNIKRILGRE